LAGWAFNHVPKSAILVKVLTFVLPLTMVINNCFVSFPTALAAFTVNVDVPAGIAIIGVPEIVPVSARVKPDGNVPLTRLQVMGVSPVAVNV